MRRKKRCKQCHELPMIVRIKPTNEFMLCCTCGNESRIHQSIDMLLMIEEWNDAQTIPPRNP